MTQFSATKRSEATVGYPRELVWEVLTDPDCVAKLTPMVRSIKATGEHWRWQLVSIPVLGQSFDIAFTERMELDSPQRITFTHDPQGEERAGTKGRYDLTEVGEGTHLRIDLTVSVDLPFPKLARLAVQGTMQQVLAVMGSGFARAIEKELAARSASRSPNF